MQYLRKSHEIFCVTFCLLDKEYPADHECRNELAFQLTSGWKETSRDKLHVAAREAAELHETVLDESKNSKERSFARSRLVWIYANLLDETELAEKHAKQADSYAAFDDNDIRSS